MSGGAFDYLTTDLECWGDLPGDNIKDKLRRMIDYCDMLHPEASPHLRELLDMINEFQAQYKKKAKQLTGLTKAVEWHASSDWGKEAIQEALDELNPQSASARVARGELPPPE